MTVNVFIYGTHVIDFKVSDSLDDIWHMKRDRFDILPWIWESHLNILVLFYVLFTLRLWKQEKVWPIPWLHDAYPETLHLPLQIILVLIGAKLMWMESKEQTDRVGFNNSWIPSLKYVISSHIDWSWFPTSLETGTQKLVPKVCGSTYLYVITKVIQNILLVIFFLTLKFFKTIEN